MCWKLILVLHARSLLFRKQLGLHWLKQQQGFQLVQLLPSYVQRSFFLPRVMGLQKVFQSRKRFFLGTASAEVMVAVLTLFLGQRCALLAKSWVFLQHLVRVMPRVRSQPLDLFQNQGLFSSRWLIKIRIPVSKLPLVYNNVDLES